MTLADFDVELRDRVLSNGVHLTHFYRKGAPLHLRVSFLSGGSFDPPGKEGVAHFAEHTLYCGTKKFPSKDAFVRFIHENGGQFNARARYYQSKNQYH